MAITEPNQVAPQKDVVLERLEDQIAWYSRSGRKAKNYFKTIKIIEIVAAALIPLIAAFSFPPSDKLVIAALGVLITILEGLLHLNQYQQLWTSYRATAETLKHEKFLFWGGCEPYASASAPRALLTERVESLVSQENSQWILTQQRAAKGSVENKQTSLDNSDG